jgi:hypothetical protein
MNGMRYDHHLPAWLCVVCVWLLCGHRVLAQPLDPLDFTSLGTLNLAGGSFTIDTDTLTLVDNGAPGVPLFTGVVDDQDGIADSFGGVPGPLGIPEVAVFTFDSINLASTASITVTGTRALGLLSQGNATIDTTINVNGANGTLVSQGTALAGGGGPGGFAGGQGFENGIGPGGGGASNNPTGSDNRAGAGSFGGPGRDGDGGATAGPTYGDLAAVLQGGSGGGGLRDGSWTPPQESGGGGGGGALEIGAAGGLSLGPAAQLLASGGGGGENVNTDNPFVGLLIGGAGSGGGIRLHAAQLQSAGAVIATGGSNPSHGGKRGGGGRVLLYGVQATLTVGQPDVPDLAALGVSVAPGEDSDFEEDLDHGVVVVSPHFTVVPALETLQLGGPPVVLQAASTTQPRIELLHRNVRADPGAELIVPAGGFINPYRIELDGVATRITGSDPLTNSTGGELRGTGSVEVEFTNDAGGLINAIGDTLTFTQPVTNHAGAQINAINSTLQFDAGLTNNGELNLINSSIVGAVSSAVTTTATLVGANSVSGDYAMAAGDTLFIDLGGTLPGQFDTLTIGGNATVAGDLNVSLDPGFSLALGNAFQIVDVTGTTTGTFNGLTDGALVGTFGGVPLFIDYDSGDGNDVTLVATLAGDFDLDFDVDGADFLKWQRGESPDPFSSEDLADWETNYGTVLTPPLAAASTAVPEPCSVTLITMASVVLMNRRARRERRGLC